MDKNEEERYSIQLDAIVKSLLGLSDRCIIGTINKFFNTNYEAGQVTIQRVDPNFHRANLNYEHIEADLVLIINGITYHMEIQTLNDKTMQVRMIEYGIQLAEVTETKDGIIKMTLPRQVTHTYMRSDRVDGFHRSVFL